MPPYSATLALLTLTLLGVGLPASAQGPQAPAAAPAPGPAAAMAPAPAGSVVANLRPALANVQTAISGLSISHWKAPSATRAATEQDVASMQRDLSTTLPGLMTQAEGASGSGALSPSFAVFRNLDALYDVLLRVTETAALAGPGSDASSLEDARAGLEDARSNLGAWLLQSMSAQDAQVVRLLAAPPRPAAPPPAPTKIVVNDGPDTTTKPHKKKPASNPATTPAPTPAPQ
jgi:hypothetical protein